MESTYHISRDGQGFGPYPLSDLQQFYASGQLVGTDLVWAEHLTGWTQLDQLPERVQSVDSPRQLVPPQAQSATPVIDAPHNAHLKSLERASVDTAMDHQGATLASDKTMAVLSHVLSIFFSWVAPLVIYLIKKGDADKFAADNAREALNFQITICILYILCFILVFVLVGIFLFWIVMLSNLVCCILAAVKASNGANYRYPLTLRLIK